MDAPLRPLTPGTAAPDFTLPHALRASTSLHALPGQPVVLLFYPQDWEPVSWEQLALYQDYLIEFERAHASVLGISVDSVWSHMSFARRVRIRFPLLADWRPRGAVAWQYGVYREQEELSARALFVLDSRRIIRFSEVYLDALNPGVSDVLTVLEGLAVEEHRLWIRDGSSRAPEIVRADESHEQ